MKKLKKIIALFLFIFLTGIIVTVISINRTLNTKLPANETVELHDSLPETVPQEKTV